MYKGKDKILQKKIKNIKKSLLLRRNKKNKHNLLNKLSIVNEKTITNVKTESLENHDHQDFGCRLEQIKTAD